MFRAQSWMKDNENRRHISSYTNEEISCNQIVKCDLTHNSFLWKSLLPTITQHYKWKAINLKLLYFWKYKSPRSGTLISSLLFLYSFSQFPSVSFFHTETLEDSSWACWIILPVQQMYQLLLKLLILIFCKRKLKYI